MPISQNGQTHSNNSSANCRRIGLKNYYGGQKRLFDSCKACSTGFRQVYQINWKFFSNLTFLQNAFTPRGTYCNDSEFPAVDTVCPSSSKSARKSEAFKRDTVQKVLETETQVMELLAELNEIENKHYFCTEKPS